MFLYVTLDLLTILILQMLKLHQEAKQKAWNYLNDSQRFRSCFLCVGFSSVITLISFLPCASRTDVGLRYKSEVSMIYS